ncbi:MAG: V-type ATP synthase subunit I [Waddliaceae bacterium]|jgi:V/A-type H+/Na+-transporting ATPase subunit I|nr:V-type ATP synthase subunit I [Waddliaceae bacterium]MBT3579067.1 V-type ATP synthase subunit I [Waddliaceae bacterium]MBT4444777.1 V-type ATP synthase subunit I [Waddliaceae bacterium]MBT6928046.1 V-type ATP synthase subunit I [Waddliaceae bacterium]MBT7264430.1 V-type ATP synthase subunit I [Waddliaceae bacterium]
MRVNVKKYLFIGAKEDHEAFFRRAQAKGIIEFIKPEATEKFEKSPEIERLISAIKILRGLPTTEQEENDIDDEDIVSEILDLHNDIEDLVEQRRMLRQERARVRAFGNFSLDDIAYIENDGKRTVQYFFAKKDTAHRELRAKDMIYVDSAHGLDYYISISKKQRSYEGMVEMYVEKPVGILRKELIMTIRHTREKERELKTLARYQSALYDVLVDKLNGHNLGASQGYSQEPIEDKLFAVTGWVAKNNIPALEILAKKMAVHIEEVAIEKNDSVPTHLNNHGISRIGEDLVNIYDTPSVIDKDPSKWVLWSFALFFAIIIGDGGYGLIFLASTIFLKIKFPKIEGMGKRVVNLMAILSCSCILWGAMTASFFGIETDIDNPIRKASIIQAAVEKKTQYHIQHRDDVYMEIVTKFPATANITDAHEFLKKGATVKEEKVSYDVMKNLSDTIRMELALLIGVIHIIMSFMRGIRRNWAGSGWILFLVGAYLYFPLQLDAISLVHIVGGIDIVKGAEAGLHLIWGGIGLAALLAIAQRRLMGILEITNVIPVFSDVLSYLRLYALGMAGAMMSGTFNDIGMSMALIPGIAVIVLGHGINIVLSIMGGVIHGLRLNFLEWYHYSFEGGGKRLKPLSLLKKK